MDLGIRGRTALVCAASKGLGKACAMALAREGANLVITARGAEALESTAQEMRSLHKVKVTAVAGDITTEQGRAAALAACPAPDILVNNAGGPPPGDFRDWDREAWVKALEGNMISPILLIRAVVDAMIARRFGRIVNITSGAVKHPIAELGLSNGARTGLTGFVAGLAGFGTGLTALGIWLHVMPPPVAASLVVVCSVAAQVQTIPVIWRSSTATTSNRAPLMRRYQSPTTGLGDVIDDPPAGNEERAVLACMIRTGVCATRGSQSVRAIRRCLF